MFLEDMAYIAPELSILEEGFSGFKENYPGTGNLHESKLRDGFLLEKKNQ